MTESRAGVLPATAIMVDPRNNKIVVRLPQSGLCFPVHADEALVGMLDMGVRGRLLGIEIGEFYIAISDPVVGSEHLTRGITVALTASRDLEGRITAVSFPRSTDTYEISFPSGNQCWRVGTGGRSSQGVCAELIS